MVCANTPLTTALEPPGADLTTRLRRRRETAQPGDDADPTEEGLGYGRVEGVGGEEARPRTQSTTAGIRIGDAPNTATTASSRQPGGSATGGRADSTGRCVERRCRLSRRQVRTRGRSGGRPSDATTGVCRRRLSGNDTPPRSEWPSRWNRGRRTRTPSERTESAYGRRSRPPRRAAGRRRSTPVARPSARPGDA